MLQQWLHTLPQAWGIQADSVAVASADASFRRYFRVNTTQSTQPSLIVMDAPPTHEDCAPFIHVAQLFGGSGVNVPKILAQDLAQLAKLYQTERAQLRKDTHLYQATDETLAATLAQRIFSELRRDQPVAQRERLGQATALLLHLYDEVAATARWLLRNKPEEAAQRFPSLIAASRRPPKKAAKPTPDAPPA